MMIAIPNMSNVNFKEPSKRGFLLLSVYLFPILLTSLLYFSIIYLADIDTKIVSNKSQYANIHTPINRSTVSKTFVISVTTETPLPNHSYYLIEFRDKLFWPKFDLGNQKNTWSKKLTHRAGVNQFSSYKVIMADTSLKKRIDKWFITSRDTGKYPGIPNIPLNSVVANIRVKTQ